MAGIFQYYIFYWDGNIHIIHSLFAATDSHSHNRFLLMSTETSWLALKSGLSFISLLLDVTYSCLGKGFTWWNHIFIFYRRQDPGGEQECSV